MKLLPSQQSRPFNWAPGVHVLCRIEVETSACFLEKECYKKYGKTGKSFYYSQVASTVRWLLTTCLSELTTRLGTATSLTSEDILSNAEPSTTSLPLLDQGPTKFTSEELNGSSRSEISLGVSPLQSTFSSTDLPEIPSFSDYVNSRKAKGSLTNTSQKQLPRTTVQKNPGKRMKL